MLKIPNSFKSGTFSLSFFLQEFFIERFRSDIRTVGLSDASTFDKSFSEKATICSGSPLKGYCKEQPAVIYLKKAQRRNSIGNRQNDAKGTGATDYS
jgi:hypothetical protein